MNLLGTWILGQNQQAHAYEVLVNLEFPAKNIGENK